MSDQDIPEVKELIHSYMACFREQFPGKVIPKQHFLECHVPEWMSTWQVGMALHGEQGGKHIHAVFNNLQASMRGVKNPLENLISVMKEHHIRTSPSVISRQPRIKRRKLFL